ncbi:MAG: insulinase family protein [Anaerolineae bacterium]|nr:insulinase family protein [Anaerolineae bacterium]
MIRRGPGLLTIQSIVPLSAVLAGIPGAGLAAAGDAQSAEPFNITTYELANGLQVILVEDHSAPTAAVSVWYEVGGAADPPGRSGFAHLFEHLMFQGSANVPRGRHPEWINAAGGNHNASTGTDRTNYFEELPAHQLPLALWLEADRMSSLVVDSDNFEREREVVKEEYRQRIENQPYGEAFLRLQTIAYDYEPYQTSVIGSIADLDRSTVEEVRQFHGTYYAPNNATLTVAGDIDVDRTQELIERYFGDIPRQDDPPALPSYPFTPQQESQELTIEDRLARVPALFMVYRIPPRREQDYYAAELLSHILGEGDSSRLARALVDTGLATVAHSSAIGNLGPSLFYVVLIPNPDVEVDQLARIFDDELDRIRNEGVDAEELNKAINGILTDQIGGLQDALGLAESVQDANFFLGDPHAVLADLDRFRAVSGQDVQRVAQDYLSDYSRNVVNVLLVPEEDSQSEGPLSEEDTLPNEQIQEVESATDLQVEFDTLVEEAESTADPAQIKLPDPLPVREFNLPEIIEAGLDNGLKVIVAPERSLPYLTMQVVLPGGESTAPPDLAGLAEFAAALLPRGTETRTAQEIAGAIEQVGGDLATAAHDNLTIATVTVLSDHTDLAFEILGDVVLHPIFPQEEIDIQRQRALTSLEATLANPAEIGHRAFDAIIYGSHPYGRNVTEQSLSAISRDDIVGYYSAQLNPLSAMLVIAGDISPEDALEKAQATFGNWASEAPVTYVDFPDQPQRPEAVIYLLDRPGSSQAEIIIGHLGMEGSSKDRYAAQVANQVLGAGSTSRLFLNLREDKGYTYGVYSGFSLPPDIGKFLVQAAVRNEATEPAIREILTEMERLGETLVPEEELHDAKSYLTGSFALRLETVRDLANHIISLKIRELPLSDLRIYPQAIEGIEDRVVLEAAQTYIRPDRAAIVIVGDASEIRESLEKIAPVVLVDTEGQVVG